MRRVAPSSNGSPARMRAQRRAYWGRMVRRCDRSGLTQGEFCEREGISLASLRAWKYRGLTRAPRRRVRAASRAFVPVRVVEPPSPAAESGRPIELVLTDDRLLRVPVGFDADTLARLVRLLG